jgi:phage-related tail fiber protein
MTGWKAPCRVVATTDIVLVGLPEIDGVPVAAGDRVLVVGQRAAAENGVYSAVAGPWVRTAGANSVLSLSRMAVRIKDGRTAFLTDWAPATTDQIMLGTTALRYVLLHR